MPLRAPLAAACVAFACAAAPTAASAKIVEVGQTPTEAVPTCPASPCLAVSRTTGSQADACTMAMNGTRASSAARRIIARFRNHCVRSWPAMNG